MQFTQSACQTVDLLVKTCTTLQLVAVRDVRQDVNAHLALFLMETIVSMHHCVHAIMLGKPSLREKHSCKTAMSGELIFKIKL